ncbi:MAG: amidohydrolase family protein [Bacillota bacterium]|nr:amidohydrolase family protein [Bacillota bacterium]
MRILTNGKIYTENPEMPWAQAVAIEGKKFAAVGTNEEVEAFAKASGADFETVDLEGRTVLPGLIDGHTHPETVAKTFWRVRMPMTEDKDELMATIKEYAEKYPKEDRPYFFGENYFTETFGTEGPKKEDLDAIINDRPARMQDFGDHACWYNSIALEMLKDENGIPHADSALGSAEFVKDENGEYTGWALEAAAESDQGIYDAIGWEPPTVLDDEMAMPLINFFRHFGITAMMDGFTEGEENMKYFYNLDKEDRLNCYYDASVALEQADKIEEAIATVKDWREKYTTEHIRINIVKFFLDGTNELGDCLSLTPFANDPTGTQYGSAKATAEEMAHVITRLNEEGIDFHVHTICDGAFRLMCDAVEAAQKACGDDWKIKVTLAHCEVIDPADMPRVHDLGIYIDWSTHWSGGYFGEEAQSFMGMERWNRMYDFSEIIKSGEHLGFSSDIYSYQEAHRSNPFFGMQTAMTKVDIEYPLDPEKYPGSMRPPERAKYTLEQLIHGYTMTNAIRMRLDDKMGSIEVGKLANLVVLDRDIFTAPAFEVKDVDAEFTYFEGKEYRFPRPVFDGRD